MKLLCTASKVSWFTVGREYETDAIGRIPDDDNSPCRWNIEPYKGRYRTERLEDAEFSVVPEYVPVECVEERPQELIQHESILAAVMQMAEEEGCRDVFDSDVEWLRNIYEAHHPENRRAFLLALAYFSEEKSQ